MTTTIEEHPLLAHEEWNDAAFRHVYPHSQKLVAICGYDGPSTWKDEREFPANLCPICRAIMPEFYVMVDGYWRIVTP